MAMALSSERKAWMIKSQVVISSREGWWRNVSACEYWRCAMVNQPGLSHGRIGE
jgi:hypothetical protein